MVKYFHFHLFSFYHFGQNWKNSELLNLFGETKKEIKRKRQVIFTSSGKMMQYFGQHIQKNPKDDEIITIYFITFYPSR